MTKEEFLKIDIRSNDLLKSIKDEDKALLLPYLKEMEVERGRVLYEPGDDVKHAYFPCDQTLISLLVPFEDGKAVEATLIGREGAIGGIVSQGRVPAYCRMVVQYPGKLICIDCMQLEEAKMASVTLRYWLARYSDCLLSQIFQSVACNATHTIEQRTAKWMCESLERTGDHIIPFKQEQLAAMLGVGRSYVARVIGNLKAKGVLQTMRGKLTIQSFDALKELSCGCNDLVDHHFETVLGGIYPTQ